MMVLEPAVENMQQSVTLSNLITAVQEPVDDCTKGISGYHMPPSGNFDPLQIKAQPWLLQLGSTVGSTEGSDLHN